MAASRNLQDPLATTPELPGIVVEATTDLHVEMKALAE